jgi:flagellar motility protein MotE (MotC chaperone)
VAKAKAVTSRSPVRLLPALIFLAVLMLSVRVGDIWKGMAHLGSVQVASDLEAQQPTRGKGPGTVVPREADVSTIQSPATSTVPLRTLQVAQVDTTSMSQTELDVLQKLSARRGQLDGREKDIERREAMLKAAEEQIDRKVSELKTLQSTIEGLLRQYNDQEDNKMRSLVKIYENMKPKEAAKIFEQLDMQILLDVIERMKEQKVAPILAEMDPGKARNVTSELAQRRQMPLPKPSGG